MTAQEYIQSKLEDLRKPLDRKKPDDTEALIEGIFKIVMSKKFRKYSASEELQAHIKNSIRINLEKQQPINFTFTHGAYKLWRFDESPEVDWAELFTLMYYTNWLKPICEIYEPGVWFDSFTDDLILPKIDNITLDEIAAYKKSYKKLLDFLKLYQPKNFKMTLTGVEEQFESSEAFDRKLEQDIARFTDSLQKGTPEVTESRRAMIELNSKATEENLKDPSWMQRNVLVHDAYITMTKREAGYTFRPDKILVFTQPLPSGVFLAVGSTKDSIAKFWTGIGVLSPRDGSYRQIILSPSQLEKAQFKIEKVDIKGLDGKNFKKIRVQR